MNLRETFIIRTRLDKNFPLGILKKAFKEDAIINGVDAKLFSLHQSLFTHLQ